MSLTRNVARNTLSQLTGKIIGTFLGLVSISLITRYLGQSGFGQYTTVMTFLQFFGILADFGLTLITVQMISEKDADQEKILSNLFTLRLISAVIFLGLAPIVVLILPYDGIIKQGVALTAASYILIALNQVLTGVFQRNLDMKKVAVGEIINRMVLLALIWLSVAQGLGLLGVLTAVVISNLAQFLILWMGSTKHAAIKFAFDKEVWLKILHLSWPITISIGLNLIYLKSDTLILSLVKSQAEVGIYGATYKVIDVLVTIPIMFSGLVLPILTREWSSRNSEKFLQVFQKGFDAMVLLAIPLIAGTWLVSTEVMRAVAGREFEASGPVLNILVIAAAIIFIGSLFGHAIIALNKQKQTIWVYGASAVLALAGYIIFIPIYSYFGAAWMTVFSEAFVSCGIIIIFCRFTGFRPGFSSATKALLSSVIMCLTIVILKQFVSTPFLALNLVIYIGGAILVYFGGLLATKAVSWDLIKLVTAKA